MRPLTPSELLAKYPLKTVTVTVVCASSEAENVRNELKDWFYNSDFPLWSVTSPTIGDLPPHALTEAQLQAAIDCAYYNPNFMED